MTALSERIAAVMAIDPSAEAIEFEGRWRTWGELAATADEVDGALAAAASGPGGSVGILLRNRPVAVGLLLGVLRAGACVVVVNPMLGPERVAQDLARLGLHVLAAERADLDTVDPGVLGTIPVTLAVDDLGAEAALDASHSPAPGEDRPGVAVRMLTSGTTGPPKRIDLSYGMVERVLQGAKHYEAGGNDDLRLRQGSVIVNSPLVHLSGFFRVVQGVADGRRLVLLPRFTVEGWVDAVRRHRPKTASLVPAALRMVYDADVPKEALESVRSVVSGTAPLDADLADAFSARYGIPVLTTYAATEFGGSVAGWNLADYQRLWVLKRGSVGRAHAGCQLRVTSCDTGRPLPFDEVGLLEVKARQLEDSGWVRTNDLARMDPDGFVWIVGRADQTILRGGFKVQPEVVRSALERLPGVLGSVVVGRDDGRLGQVPVALVEPVPGVCLDPAALLALLVPALAPYEMPVEIRVVEELPRTPTAKVDLAAARALASATGPGEDR